MPHDIDGARLHAQLDRVIELLERVERASSFSVADLVRQTAAMRRTVSGNSSSSGVGDGGLSDAALKAEWQRRGLPPKTAKANARAARPMPKGKRRGHAS